MSENEIADILSVADKGQVFTLRFTDGTEAELMDFWVSVSESGTRECVATIVRSPAQSEASPGEAIRFALSEVADVQVSPDGFKYHR